MSIYLASVALFLIGIYCVSVKKNLIKMVVGILVMEYAVNLFLVMLGYGKGGVEPLPQALVLLVILTGLATIVTLVAIAMRIYERYGTFDVSQIMRLRG